MSKEPVSRKQAEERLRYLKSELAHEGYHDGWTLKGMREEVEWLEKELKKLDFNNKIKKMLNWKPTIDLEDWLPKWKKGLNL